jgi:ubiquinone/menaquinone biosynthesis C-methylase UbiE
VSFDRIAPHYRWIETLAFGNTLQSARTLWIRKIPRPKRSLILGEGNGRFLCALLRAHPKIDVDCIDASRDMLRIARRRVERKCPESLPHVRFLRRDILRWSPQASYNLLITHFFLDCFQSDQLEEIIAKLSRAASAGAVWLLADFTIPTQPFARLHALLWLCMMYTFFRATTGITANSIVDPTSFLAANRFVRTKEKSLRWRMIKSEAYVAQAWSASAYKTQ